MYTANLAGMKIPRKHHFSLIELLVVISIIFMLFSMLMPGVRKAISKAKFSRWSGFKQNQKASPNMVLYLPLDVLDTNHDLENSAVTNSDPTLLVEQYKAVISGATWIHGGGRWSGKSALYFDGDDSVIFKKYTGVMGTNPRTICMWVKMTDAGRRCLCYWGDVAAGPGYWEFYVQGGVLQVECWWGHRDGTKTINDGQWHLIASVFSNDGTPSMGDIVFYIDGVKEVTSGSTTAFSTAPDDPVNIGGQSSSSSPFVGYIDEFALYTEALSANEIRNMYEMGKP